MADDRSLEQVVAELAELASRVERLEQASAPEVLHREPPPQKEPMVATPVKPPPLAPPVAPPMVSSAGPVAQTKMVQLKRVAARPRKEKRSLEMMIGRQWMAWAGALIVVLGVGFFFKMAYDAGWFGRLSEVMRCVLAAGFGLALIGVGELAMRRLGRMAAVGLMSAGIGTLYLSVYFALRMSVVGEAGGMLLLGLVAAVGFLLTWRTRSLAIGVLGVVGGYMSPLLFGLGGGAIAMPLYLSMMLGVSLSLSAVARKPFRPLRYVALGGHGLVGIAWVLGIQSEWMVVLPFMTIWWGMVAAEVLIAGVRDQSSIGNAVASLLSTLWFVTVGGWMVYSIVPSGPAWMGAFTGGVGLLAAAAALHFGPGLEALRKPGSRAIDMLAMALWAQAGALVVVAAGFQFDGAGQSLAWLAMGLAAVEVGRRLPSAGVMVFGLTVGALGLARIAILDQFSAALQGVVVSVGEVELTKHGLLALVGVAATFVSAWRVRRNGGAWGVISGIVLGLGVGLWMLWCVMVADGLVVTTGWLIIAALLLVMRRVGVGTYVAGLAGVVIACAGLRWLVMETGMVGSNWMWLRESQMPVWNWSFAMAVVVALIGSWCLARLSKDEDDGAAQRPLVSMRWQPLLCVVITFLAVAMSFEVDRALAAAEQWGNAGMWPVGLSRVLWLCGLFGVVGAVAMLATLRNGWRTIRWYGATVLGVAVVVWLTAGTLFWRIVDGRVDALVVVNPQFLIGAGLGALLVMSSLVMARSDLVRGDDAIGWRVLPRLGWGLAMAIGLWLGSIAIDRLLGQWNWPVHTGLSIWWALFGVGLVLGGFMGQVAAWRWVGLGLFGITVGKVLLVDMSEVNQMFRVASAVGVGLLLLGTSVAYAKVAPRLIAGDGESGA